MQKIGLLTLLITTLLSFEAFADTKEFVIPSSHMIALAPPFVNKDFYLLEFGFVSEKKIKFKTWTYPYDAYVTATLSEDWLDQKDRLRAGGLGFKAGVMLPTQPWIPLLFTTTLGFAKTALNRQPLIGNESQNVDKKDMFLIEGGALYRYDKYYLRFAYQLSNVKYFKRKTFFMLGVNY